MRKGKQQYSIILEGDGHRCTLPRLKGFERGAVIECVECQRRATVQYNGYVGNYWDGPMVNNQ